MKNKILFLFSMISVLNFNSCSKSPRCWGDDTNKGLIEKKYSMNEFPFCIERYVEDNEHLIINDTTELQSLLDSCLNLADTGNSLVVPEIDFNIYSLLGFWITGKCEADFDREVVKDEKNKKYIYIIKVVDCGWCYASRYDANLVLVPKLDSNYIVEFKKVDKD